MFYRGSIASTGQCQQTHIFVQVWKANDGQQNPSEILGNLVTLILHQSDEVIESKNKLECFNGVAQVESLYVKIDL